MVRLPTRAGHSDQSGTVGTEFHRAELRYSGRVSTGEMRYPETNLKWQLSIQVAFETFKCFQKRVDFKPCAWRVSFV